MDEKRISTLVDLLRSRADELQHFAVYTFASEQEQELSYGQLDEQARAIAGLLKRSGAAGKCVLLLYSPGPEYIAAFFGCLYAGAIAIPAYPPRRTKPTPRLITILADAQAGFILTTTPLLHSVEMLLHFHPQERPIQVLVTDTLNAQDAADWQHFPATRGEDLAFIQYTSGSTAAPKGVMLSHANLLHNLACIKELCGYTRSTRAVSWLPPYHDLGLIGGILQPMYSQFPVTLMQPAAFIQSPLKWLQTISRTRATTSAAPNFAYELCARKSLPSQCEGLDLSHWNVAIIGAEPVRPATLEKFTEVFAPYGFHPGSWYPSYALAEATLIVSGGRITESPIVRSSDSLGINQNSFFNTSTEQTRSRGIVSCGHISQDEQVLIAHPDTGTRCSPGEVGEIWVSSLSVAQGYWRKEAATQQTFCAYLTDTREGPFLRTGDLGFLNEGELFVTGRLKDLILIRGRNLYPQDIELTMQESHPLLRPDCGAAFSIELQQQEWLVVVQEVERITSEADFEPIIAAICEAIAEQHEVRVYAVILLRPGHIARTSSGKIQRHMCRQQFLTQTLPALHTHILMLQGTVPGESVDPSLHNELILPDILSLSAKERINVIENYVCEILSRLLNIPRDHIDVQKPLLTFGLDSLNSIELSHTFASNFAVNISQGWLLQGASVLDLVAYIIQSLSASPNGKQPMRTASPFKEYPLSYGQQALHLIQTLMPDTGAYNIARAIRISQELNSGALQQSLQILIDRHSSLRTSFSTDTHQEPRQYIHEQGKVFFRAIETTTWNDAQFHQAFEEEVNRPFDLQQDALLRICLFSCSPQEQILLFVVHHIIADMWSLAILVQELGVLYTALSTNSEYTLPEIRVHYADYVQWQADFLTSDQGKRQEAYWQQQIMGAPMLNLPTQHLQPLVRSHKGSVETIFFSAALTTAIKEFSQQQQSTLYVTLLAAFQVLLYRYNGQEQFLVGSPVSGRSEPEWSHLVGYLVNLVAIRANLAGHQTFVDVLQQVKQCVFEALNNSDYSFALASKQFHMKRDLSHSSLLQAVFAWQQFPYFQEQSWNALALGLDGFEMKLGDLCLKSVALKPQDAQFDLMLSMGEVNRQLVASLQYDTELFDAFTISSMLKHFRELLYSITLAPEQKIAMLSLLTRDEQEQIRVRWNDTQVNHDTEINLLQLFEEQVKQAPDAVALVYEDTCLTYEKLNHFADQVGSYLQIAGIRDERIVGLYMERSLEMVFCLLGILKAGGVYLPLDPSLPTERLLWMLENAQAEGILTREYLVSTGVFPQIPKLYVETILGTQYQQQRGHTGLSGTLSALSSAYLIYTSGSTGKPKGVQVEQRALVNLLLAMRKQIVMGASDRLIAVSTISFDIALFDLLFPLTTGASITLLHSNDVKDGYRLGQIIEQMGGTFMQATPATWQLLQDTGWQNKTDFTAISTGEAFPQSLAQWLTPQVRVLWNLYGPTETTIWSAGLHLSSAEESMLIGYPLENTKLYILDQQWRMMLPVGVVGEIYIGGSGVARGYLNAPDLTAERFVPDHISGAKGERLYRTGDLGKYRIDGRIEYLGRTDTQVKVRGYRIELGEIETSLRKHHAIRECVVVVQKDAYGDRRLIAYVVFGEQQSATVEALREYLAQQLPSYMLPAMFVMLQTLPLTTNGKVDRHALPLPEISLLPQGEGFAVPRTPLEELLVMIWSNLLGQTQISIHDDFFVLGGHSLLATRVVARIRQTTQVELPLRSLFENPTIVQLAQQIEQQKQGQPQVSLPRFMPFIRSSRDVALSFAQERLWFLNQWEPQSSVYHMSAALRLTGHLFTHDLEQSLTAVIQRHEILRTTFALQGHHPVQVIAPSLPVQIPLIDIQGYPSSKCEDLVRQLGLQEARNPFDLTQGPLLRVTLICLDKQEHVLLFTMHHIISDGWSMGILVREVTAFYQARIKGEPSYLPALPLQYADYALWQRKWLLGEIWHKQLDYWQEQLVNAPEFLSLPTDRPRPVLQTHNGDVQMLLVPTEMQQQLKIFSQQEGVTLFMTLLAAFQVLLMRYSGQQDIVVGTPISNRMHEELEGLIGFFLNTLVLRTDLSGNPRFRQLLANVREVALQAYAHQDIPFEQLVEALQPERSLSYSPLFQVLFVMQNAPQEELMLGDITWQTIEVGYVTTKFDLTFALTETTEGLLTSLEYNIDLFEASTISRLLQHWLILLESIVARPYAHLNELSLLSEEERHQLLISYNSTSADYPGNHCFPALFDQQVAHTPDRVALFCHDEQFTFFYLQQRANQLAHYLLAHGVRPEAPVGLLFDRSPLMIISLLAILKAGGIYLPLDPSSPSEHLTWILQNAAPVILLSEHPLQKLVSLSSSLPLFCLPQEWSSLKTFSTEDPGSLPHPLNAAYILYTSGSTGTPKGVVVSHTNLLNYLFAIRQRFDLEAGGHFAMLQPLTVDFCLTMLAPALTSESTLHLIDHDCSIDPELFAHYCQEHPIDYLKITPSHLAALRTSHLSDSLLPLRHLILGGEASSWFWVQELQRAMPASGRVSNHYGPTEATVGVLTYSLSETSQHLETTLTPLGTPLSNTQVYVLDALLQPVPIGVVGELYLAGDGLARGYLEQPVLTALCFLPHPYSDKPGARLYRTGDLVRYHEDGVLQFVGRRDEQIKLRGFRFELGEIESVLSQHPAVRDIVVHPQRREPGSEPLLIAYVVLEAGRTLTLEQLQHFGQHCLSDYMLPSAMECLERLPLSRDGKVARLALPVPQAWTEPERASLSVACTPFEEVVQGLWVEEVVRGLWCKVLGIERIGINDNFFDLGGHSLLAIQLASRISEHFMVDVSLQSLFANPTIPGQTTIVEELLQGGKREILPVLKSGPRAEKIPLSFAQLRLWFLDRFAPGDPSYNNPMVVRLNGLLNLDILTRSINEIVRRHEILRTTFAEIDGEPTQVIASEAQVFGPVIDVQVLTESRPQYEIQKLISQEASLPFDLSRGPLLRCTLLRLAADQHVLLLTVHHIVFDAWSIGVLANELNALYAALIEQRPSPLPPLQVQYADYALWQRNWLQGAMLERHLAYWRTHLADVPALLSLPTDRPRPAVQRFVGASFSFVLPEPLSLTLTQFSRQEGVTLFMTLLAAFQLLLARYCNQDDLLVSSGIADRWPTLTEELIGCFINTLLLRTHLEAQLSVHHLLRRVRDTVLDAYAHRVVPFEQLVALLDPERDLSFMPYFQTMLVLLNTPPGSRELTGVTLEPLESSTNTAQCDLLVHLWPEQQQLVGQVHYNTDLFEQATIHQWVTHFERVLQAMVEQPEQHIGLLSFLTEDEIADRLGTWNATQQFTPAQLCLHELVAIRTNEGPDRIAVIVGGHSITYATLQRQVYQLAWELQEQGVRPEVRVGLCFEQSVDFVVSILAVLQAGGAYIPLDPAYPPARLEVIMRDVQPVLLLTQRSLRGLFPEELPGVLVLDEERKRLARKPVTPPSTWVTAGNLAYVMCTSGSTGTPKGVVLQHRGVVNNLIDLNTRFAVGAGDKVLMLSSVSFDMCVYEAIGLLGAGGTVVVPEPHERRDPGRWARLLQEQAVTLWHSAPALLEMLLTFLEESGQAEQFSLRVALLGGDWIPLDMPARLKTIAHEIQVISLGGATEASIHSIIYPIKEHDPGWMHIPYGRPMTNQQAYILDSQAMLVPVNVVGELCLGGVGLARGYWNDPQLTAECFQPHPFSREPGQRLYRTRDMARYRADGTIELVGRRDRQVKLRGYRIELGEIETVLRDQAGVGESAVILREERTGEKQLVAYVVWKESKESGGLDEVQVGVQKRLPAYMVPSRYVELKALPLSPNGKVDRRALPAPTAIQEEDEHYVGPRTPVEELLAEIWGEVLGIKRVSIHENFFTLGGHSLLATQVIARVRRVFQVDLPLSDFFQMPTIAYLAEVIMLDMFQKEESDVLMQMVLEIEKDLLNEEDIRN